MEAGARTRRLTAVRREEARVTALELFFDLVFVLAVTQCTALMANDATWQGLFRGLLVLAVLWWPWSGYAWLTSVVDPEEGAVQIAMFAAMAAFLPWAYRTRSSAPTMSESTTAKTSCRAAESPAARARQWGDSSARRLSTPQRRPSSQSSRCLRSNTAGADVSLQSSRSPAAYSSSSSSSGSISSGSLPFSTMSGQCGAAAWGPVSTPTTASCSPCGP